MNNDQRQGYLLIPDPCSLLLGTPSPPSYIFKTLQIILTSLKSIRSDVCQSG
jgi:hypothetical protein